MIRQNKITYEITCPQGDTGIQKFRIKNNQEESSPISGVAIFSICEYTGLSCRTLKYKVLDINNDNVVIFLLDNEFTNDLPINADLYWDLRVITDPEYDENNNIAVEDSTDEVHSVFASREDGMPKFTVPDVAYHIGGCNDGYLFYRDDND